MDTTIGRSEAGSGYRRATWWSALALGVLLPTASALAAQATGTEAARAQATANLAGAAPQQPLTIADYARWRSIQTPVLSDDGAWVAWSYGQLRTDDQLHVRHVDSGREHVVARASRPVFSKDGRWVAYSVAPPFDEVEKLEADRKPVPRRAELMNLETGDKVGWENAASFEFSPGSTHLAVRKARPDPRPKYDGTDLILRSLDRGTDELIAAVSQHAFDRAGALLAFTVDAADGDGNGLYLTDLGAGARRVLDNADARYARLTWSEDGRTLAVLRGKDDDALMERANALLVFTGVAPGRVPVRVHVAPDAPGLPAGHVISEKATLSCSDDNGRIFFGIKEQEAKPEEAKGWMKPSDVDVFHWDDARIQSVQSVQASQDRDRTDRAVLHVASGALVRLTDPTARSIQLTRDGRWGVASDDRAYVSDWEESRADYFRVDVNTGARTPVLEAHIRTLGLSPDSRRFLYWKDGHVWAYELAADRHVNLTARAPVSFVNTEFDRFGEKPPYGVTGWTSDGRGVVLEHRYDLWLVPLDGSAPRNLTDGVGAEREVRFRYQVTDPEERFIDLSKPLLLSAYGEWTKDSGFWELRGGRLRELRYEAAHFGRLDKAARADRFLLTRESWTEFPDLQVTGPDLSQLRRITDANPQQAEYGWGRRILFDYTNADGVPLQGTLAIPDGYQPGQRLPMLVNFYEKNSQNLHRYQTPRYASSPQFAGYVSNGYLVMQPDIHFRGGTSHSDMLECVEAAVRKVIEMGYADPARVGLHGHSYSGGGASFIATRSNMFAGIVAGAAPINLIGEFNILFRGSGQNNHRYDIYGQGRYGTNPYDDFDLYWSQSPISGVTTMDTPLLYMHGAADPTVEYLQGVEFYNALRFNRKPVIFLSYPGEGHSLSKLENQLDYLVRMEQFFGYHLRGESAPAWIVQGEAFLAKDRRQPIPVNVAQPAQGPQPTTATDGGTP